MKTNQVTFLDAVRYVDAPNTDALVHWINEVRDQLAARNSKTSADVWSQIGPNVVIIHPYDTLLKRLGPRMAQLLGIPFVGFQPDAEPTENQELNTQPIAGPALVWIASGEWQSLGSGAEVDRQGSTPAGRVRRLLESFDPGSPTICVTVVSSIGELSGYWSRVGRFDRRVIVPGLSMLEAGQRFISLVGKDKCDNAVLSDPARIGALLDGRFGGPEGSRLAALAVARAVRRKKAPIQWADLVKLIVSNLQEEEAQQVPIKNDLERVAWHEAGHALMLCLVRDGERVPDFVSVVPALDSEGVTTDSFSYRARGSKFDTVEDFIEEIRVSLAGRAAEELAYGPAGISNGCSGDLERCTRLARKAFSIWGFAGDHSTTTLGAKNLAVALNDDDEAAKPRIDSLVRNFLSVQYETTLNILSAQIVQLEKIKAMLVKNGVVLCDDMKGLIGPAKAA